MDAFDTPRSDDGFASSRLESRPGAFELSSQETIDGPFKLRPKLGGAADSAAADTHLLKPVTHVSVERDNSFCAREMSSTVEAEQSGAEEFDELLEQEDDCGGAFHVAALDTNFTNSLDVCVLTPVHCPYGKRISKHSLRWGEMCTFTGECGVLRQHIKEGHLRDGKDARPVTSGKGSKMRISAAPGTGGFRWKKLYLLDGRAEIFVQCIRTERGFLFVPQLLTLGFEETTYHVSIHGPEAISCTRRGKVLGPRSNFMRGGNGRGDDPTLVQCMAFPLDLVNTCVQPCSKDGAVELTVEFTLRKGAASTCACGGIYGCSGRDNVLKLDALD
jgi:hypothetical protein